MVDARSFGTDWYVWKGRGRCEGLWFEGREGVGEQVGVLCVDDEMGFWSFLGRGVTKLELGYEVTGK